MTTLTQTQVQIGAGARSIAVTIFLLGAGLVYVAGFAHPMILHNVAHDSRHALSFPCH